ncbi:3-oxoacyl-ACP synthase III family protein [Pseudonocardia endophytica]|uniref:3-oxoacyl-[acyl-carrier-protein] synthase-3 n=1 Tax=Pseudonocardia endophytica TaxID=401976 RepID=A0A4R1HME2_PSEEN|nr:ketoacyl-ACP synthase III family protein [Pseudonocardia endophytica]TCK22301.1 3-oxoacyl-[acyl-carrier-protein] synthase-3 [Pseudonocardia endophytica]
MLYLERVSSAVPDTTVSVADLQEVVGFSDDELRLYTRYFGLDRIAVAGELELGDMLVAAGDRALDGVDRDAVRHLVHTHSLQHVGPRYRLDDVRRELGLRNASAFDLSHVNCVAGLHALHVARSLLAGGAPEDKVLVLAGDRTFVPQMRVIPGTTIQGDGAAACLVGRDTRGHRVLGRALHVMGRFYRGAASPEDLQREYGRLYVDSLTDAMRAALDDARQDPSEIALVLPHNVNRLSWPKISASLGIPKGRTFLDNVRRYAHCYSADPFINLTDVVDSGRVRPGDVVLLVSAGVGAAFASTVVRIGEGTGR